MQITIQRPKLATALNYVSKAVSTKPNIPVLSNVLIEVKGDQLKLSSTNLDMGINMWVPGVGGKDGHVTASGKFLTDFINAATGDKVNLSLEGDVLKVETEKSKAEFQTIPATEFPVLPKVEQDPYLTLPTSEFIDAMHKVIFACAADNNTSTIQFTGVLFELEEKSKHISFIGLNGFRLSQKRIRLAEANAESTQLIVPAKSLQEFVKILDAEADDEIKMYVTANKSQAIFVINDLEFSIRLLEGPYPEYKGVIPTDYEFCFEVEKSDFEKSLRVINTFARSITGNKVSWDLNTSTSELLMHTEVVDLGKNETILPVQEVKGTETLKGAFSLQFLMDFVSHTNSDKIRFETNGPLAGAIFTDKSDPDFLHLIMPVLRDDV